MARRARNGVFHTLGIASAFAGGRVHHDATTLTSGATRPDTSPYRCGHAAGIPAFRQPRCKGTALQTELHKCMFCNTFCNWHGPIYLTILHLRGIYPIGERYRIHLIPAPPQRRPEWVKHNRRAGRI